MSNVKAPQWLRFALIFIALLPIMIFRDFTPDNELKYLSIANEAIAEGNIFAFFNHGAAYADKPPLYLWAIILCKLIFGEHCMFALSLFSVVPALVIVYIMSKWVSKFLSKNERITGELMLFTSVYFIAPMIVLRMDMLMTMFIVLSLYTFYVMYEFNKNNPISTSAAPQNKKKFRKLQILLPVYIFMALFTKGPVGILVPLVTIITFLCVKREINTLGKYLGWKCWAIIGGCCVVWFGLVYLDGGKDYLNNLLFNQTVNRAVDAFDHKKPFYFYGVTYWFSLAPWSLLAFVAILLGYCKRMVNTDIAKLFTSVIFSTIIMLSLISSKLEIYLLPCFPFIIYLTAMLIPKLGKNIFIKISLLVPAIVFAITLPASIVMDKMISSLIPSGVELWAPVWLFTSILFIGGCYTIYSITKNRIGNAANSIATALLVTIFAASFSVNSFNKIIGMEEGCNKAMELAQEKKIENFTYYRLKGGDNFDVYLNRQLQELKEEELATLENTVLFIKTKYIKRDSLLNVAVADKERYEFGAFSVIPFEKNNFTAATQQ